MRLIKVEILKRGYGTTKILISNKIISISSKNVYKIINSETEEIEYFVYASDEPIKNGIEIQVDKDDILAK